jgi:hypothetical protein
MRFMTMVKSAENHGPPPPALLAAIAQGAAEATRAGTLVMTGGLVGSAKSTRVRVQGGRVTVMDGPFTEAKEVVGGYAVLEVASRQAAIDGAKWLMELHAKHWPGWEGEVEVREIWTNGR